MQTLIVPYAQFALKILEHLYMQCSFVRSYWSITNFHFPQVCSRFQALELFKPNSTCHSSWTSSFFCAGAFGLERNRFIFKGTKWLKVQVKFYQGIVPVVITGLKGARSLDCLPLRFMDRKPFVIFQIFAPFCSLNSCSSSPLLFLSACL